MTSMTDSFMRCCTRLLSLPLCGLLLAWLCAAPVHAEGISVGKAVLRQADDGYQLAASFDVSLNFAVQQALSRGIPLYFVGEFALTRSRWYWLDEDIFQGEQTIKFSYNVLTRQYRIARGALFQNFASLDDALNILARQSSEQIPAGLLDKGSNYTAAVRLRLDITQLPKLLQVNALTGKDWNLDSGWYRWIVQPAASEPVGGGIRPE